MTKYDKNISFKDVLDNLKLYNNIGEEHIELERAFNYVREKHFKTVRKSGETYVEYLLNTAMILTRIYASTETIIASFLRDILNETDVNIEEIRSIFGDEITKIVIAVNKLTKIKISTESNALIDYYKKIVVGLAEDVRVIIIILADILANMRTLWALDKDKQKIKAKEALEIYAPIAHHLGIHKIKSELEDLSLKYLKPEIFHQIADKLSSTKKERDRSVNEMIQSVIDLLEENHIHAKIKGRSKSIYSIYKKLESGKSFNQIYDFLALRVLVEKESECYQVLGLIHSKYKPYPGRFKDYVAMPKPNGYQSLHTTVFGKDSNLYEIQIRTKDMDEFAENGVASHWAYKEKKNLKEKSENLTEQKLQFFKSIIEMNENKLSSEELINSFKEEIQNTHIYVYTPKGDILELQSDSTPIDFAYRIHSKVGEIATGAIVNDKIVPLDYTLKDGDVIKIITDKNSPGPSREWLKFVKSTQVKAKIKAFFNKTEKENYVERGKDSLEKALRKRKLSISNFLSKENIDIICKEMKVDNLDDIYLIIGKNVTNSNHIVNIIDKPVIKSVEEEKKITIKNHKSPVIVDKVGEVKVSLAACCNPIPGDDIIGFITKTSGIKIHRKECENIKDEYNRYITVKWNNKKTDKFVTIVLLYSKSNKMLTDIINKANSNNIFVDSMNTIYKDKNIIYKLKLLVHDKEKLDKFLRELESFTDIVKTERLIN